MLASQSREFAVTCLYGRGRFSLRPDADQYRNIAFTLAMAYMDLRLKSTEGKIYRHILTQSWMLPLAHGEEVMGGPVAMTAADIGRAVGVDRHAASRALNGLIRKDFVRRSTSNGRLYVHDRPIRDLAESMGYFPEDGAYDR
jgi:CRP-like cAMP-binding protein